MLKSLAKNTQVRRLLEKKFKGFANELEVQKTRSVSIYSRFSSTSLFSAFISHYCLSLTFVFSLL